MTNPLDQSSILFVSLSLPEDLWVVKDEGTDRESTVNEIRLHTGLGSPYSHTYEGGRPAGYWHSFVGIGDLVRITEGENTSKTSSQDFILELGIPSVVAKERATIDLLHATAYAKLEDQDVCVFALDYNGSTPSQPPQLLFIARVSNVTISEQTIGLSCYTASSQMDKVHYYPTVWNDFQQKSKVDEDDEGLRFANLTGSEAELNFP